MGWPLAEELTEPDLAIALFPGQPRCGHRHFVEPDLAVVRQEVARKSGDQTAALARAPSVPPG